MCKKGKSYGNSALCICNMSGMFALVNAWFQVDGVAVGFMSLCKDINIDLLNNCFELAPFHGLRKPHPDDVVKRSFPESMTPLPAMPGNSSKLINIYTLYRC